MARLLQIFGFLSVLFRGGTLSFGSLTIGGIVFLNFVARSASSTSEAVNNACLRWIRRSALALAVMQLAYVLASSLILMQSADMTVGDVSGANFVLADFGSVAKRLVRSLERKGILIRDRRDFPREGFVRISAGTRADTRKVLRAIEGVL